MCVHVCYVVLLCCLLVHQWEATQIARKALGWIPICWDKQQDAGWGMATRNTFGEGDQGELSLSLDQGHEGRIREVLQENSCSSMYKSWLCVLTCAITVCFRSMSDNYLRPENWFMLLIADYFQRLKINHDSHEFILESGIVANIRAPLQLHTEHLCLPTNVWRPVKILDCWQRCSYNRYVVVTHKFTYGYSWDRQS
jgi:hypothetical protein